MIRDETMPDLLIGKIAVLIDMVRHEDGPLPQAPRRRAAGMALAQISLAGCFGRRGELAAGDIEARDGSQ